MVKSIIDDLINEIEFYNQNLIGFSAGNFQC